MPRWDNEEEGSPRVCGEQGVLLEIPCPARGITPACAGNSSYSRRAFDLLQDHPRVCGEQPVIPQTIAGTEGSPPRVRGTAEEEKYQRDDNFPEKDLIA